MTQAGRGGDGGVGDEAERKLRALCGDESWWGLKLVEEALMMDNVDKAGDGNYRECLKGCAGSTHPHSKDNQLFLTKF